MLGSGFGAEFIPIYQRHPQAEMYAICQRDRKKLDQLGDALKVAVRYTDYRELLKDPRIDAVHINSPIPDHAWMTLAALEAGKHVACTVPMATSVDDCRKIVELSQKNGLKYMMMETTVYSREFFFVKEMLDRGELGRIQFLRAAHQQEMAGWPGYWEGLPPMYYATHCVGPVLALPNAQAEYVSCFGSGRIDETLIAKYGSPFAVETCHIKMKGNDLAAEITRSLFNTARQYRRELRRVRLEAIVRMDAGRTWETDRLHRRKAKARGGARLCESLARADPAVHDRAACTTPRSISIFRSCKAPATAARIRIWYMNSSGARRRTAIRSPNAVKSANWTCVGIVAHDSAMAGGKLMPLPEFTLE